MSDLPNKNFLSETLSKILSNLRISKELAEKKVSIENIKRRLIPQIHREIGEKAFELQIGKEVFLSIYQEIDKILIEIDRRNQDTVDPDGSMKQKAIKIAESAKNKAINQKDYFVLNQRYVDLGKKISEQRQLDKTHSLVFLFDKLDSTDNSLQNEQNEFEELSRSGDSGLRLKLYLTAAVLVSIVFFSGLYSIFKNDSNRNELPASVNAVDENVQERQEEFKRDTISEIEKPSTKTSSNTDDIFDENTPVSFQLTHEHFAITRTAFSPSGRLVATGSFGGVYIWNVEDGRLVKKMNNRREDAPERLTALCFLNENTVVTATNGMTIAYWNISSGTKEIKFSVSDMEVDASAFSRDGTLLATVGNSFLMIWDLKKGNRIMITKVATNTYCSSLCISPNNRYVAATTDATYECEIDTGRQISKCSFVRGYDNPMSSCFSPDSQWSSATFNTGRSCIWDVKSGKILKSFESDTKGRIWTSAFSSDTKLLATGGDGGMIRLYSIVSGNKLFEIQAGGNIVRSLQFSPDNKKLLSTAEQGPAQIWNLRAAANKNVDFQMKKTRSLKSAKYSPDGKNIITTGVDGFVRIWNADTGKEKERFLLSGRSSTPRSVNPSTRSTAEYSPDGKIVLTHCADMMSSEHSMVYVRQLADEKWIGQFQDVPDQAPTPIADVRFSKDGKYLAKLMLRSVLVWDFTTKKLVLNLDLDKPIVCCDFSPDCMSIAIGATEGTATVTNISSSKLICELEGHESSIHAITFSSDGKSIATASHDKTARIWEVSSGTEKTKFTGHSESLTGISFSPDGKKVITSSEDKTARIWDAKTGKELNRLSGHTEGVISCSYSPDGKHVLTLSEDCSARIWDTKSGKEIRKIEMPLAKAFTF